MRNWSPVKFVNQVFEKIRSNETLKKIVYNTSWLFADRIIRMGVGVIVIIWIARYLGPEQFGIYNYAIAFVALFTAFASLGLDSIVVREIVRTPGKKNEILGTALFLKLCGGITTFGILTVIIFILRPDDALTRIMVVIIAGTLIFQSFDIIDFWFQSQVQSKYTVIAKNSAFLCITGVHIGLILSNASLVAFAWARLGEIFLFSAGLVFLYHYTGSALRQLRLQRERIKTLLRDGWPLMLSGIMIMIYMRIDQVMLGELIGDESVGIYSAAIRLTEVWYFIPTAILISVFPSIVETKENDKGLYYRRLQRLYNLLTWAAIGIAIPVTVVSAPAITLIYGTEYAEAASVLTITIWAGIFVFQGVARSKWLVAENLQKYGMLFTVFGAILNVILNILLIPMYEVIGAAIATLISQGMIVLVIPLLFQKTRYSSLMLFRAFVFGKLSR